MGGEESLLGIGRTLNTNMDIVLLRLLNLAGVFIRFRERVERLEILDGHTRAVWARRRWGLLL